MMLYLVQHGEALAESVDQRKSLSPAGTRDVQALGARCASYGISAREIVHSGKARAAQSAEILGQALAIK